MQGAREIAAETTPCAQVESVGILTKETRQGCGASGQPSAHARRADKPAKLGYAAYGDFTSPCGKPCDCMAAEGQAREMLQSSTLKRHPSAICPAARWTRKPRQPGRRVLPGLSSQGAKSYIVQAGGSKFLSASGADPHIRNIPGPRQDHRRMRAGRRAHLSPLKRPLLSCTEK
jgi:hypothetical protein